MRRRVIPAPRYAFSVSVRLTGALVAVLALLAVLPAAASAQLSKGAQRVLDDYRSDAAIRPCDHTVKLYRRTLREITPDLEEQTPAFRPAVEAALRDRQKGTCDAPGDSQQEDESVGGSTTPPSTPPVTPPTNEATPAPVPATPRPATPLKPVNPAPSTPKGEATPAPTATPTATVAPAPPVTSSAPVAAADPVLLDRPHEGTPVGLLVALAVLALGLLLVLLLLAARRFDRLPGARHAWGEAAYRAGGTWGDFVDWVRFGR